MANTGSLNVFFVVIKIQDELFLSFQHFSIRNVKKSYVEGKQLKSSLKFRNSDVSVCLFKSTLLHFGSNIVHTAPPRA